MKITIPFRTPTINLLYWHRGNMKIMKTEAKNMRKKIAEIVKPAPELNGKELKVTVNVYENWYNKNGTIKKKDVANREKFLIDSIFKALEVDDKCIFKYETDKVQSDKEEFAVVEIVEL